LELVVLVVLVQTEHQELILFLILYQQLVVEAETLVPHCHQLTFLAMEVLVVLALAAI
jgi:hypothetical protein